MNPPFPSKKLVILFEASLFEQTINMRLFFQPNPLNALVRGILTIGVGILILTVPGLTLQSVIMTIGVMILVNGMFTLLFSYLKPKNGRGAPSFPGLFNILLSIPFLIAPLVIVKVFGFFFGFIFLMIGVMQFFGALAALSKSFWAWVYLAFALMMTSGGLFLLVKPIQSAENILTFFGAILVLYGILEIFTAWRIRKMPPRSNSGNVVDTTYEEV
jgi:uncharacterized membrane protein HdeD (DUF308 family)